MVANSYKNSLVLLQTRTHAGEGELIVLFSLSLVLRVTLGSDIPNQDVWSEKLQYTFQDQLGRILDSGILQECPGVESWRHDGNSMNPVSLQWD